MQGIIPWYFVVESIGILAFPLCRKVFHKLPDRGYLFAKSLGILMSGFLFWFGWAHGLIRNTTTGAWIAVVLLAATGLVAARRISGSENTKYTFRVWLRENWPSLLAGELLFLLAFVFWALVRSFDPSVDNTEQPMDMMFLNGIWTSTEYPPHDPWFSGYAISYYYFGYWLLAMISRLAGQLPETAYNLGQACWFGLLVSGTYGMGYNLLRMKRKDIHPSESVGANHKGSSKGCLTPLLGALFFPLCTVMASNLQGLLDFILIKGTYLWWWPSSRVIKDMDLTGGSIEAISEFPIFSYIVGDNHPHLLAMPFVVLVLALSLNLFLAASGPRPSSKDRRNDNSDWSCILSIVPSGWTGLSVIAVTSGALIFLNPWDYPINWIVLSVSFLVTARRSRISDFPEHSRHWILPSLAFALLLPLSAAVIYFPFLITAQSQASGIVLNLLNPTRFSHFVLVFGSFLFGLTLLIVRGCTEIRPRGRALFPCISASLLVPALFPAAWGFLNVTGQSWFSVPDAVPSEGITLRRWLDHPLTYVLVGSYLGILCALILQGMLTWPSLPAEKDGATPTAEPAFRFVLLLAGAGMLAIYIPEFVFVRDLFGSRMNTVFKFHYQAWLLLGLSTAYAVTTSFRERKLLAVFGFVMPCLCLIYAVVAVSDVTGGFSGSSPTLSSFSHLQENSPEQLAAIRWVQRNTSPQAVIAEGKGVSYNPRTCVISTFTGRPTLLGWEGHQIQWRGRAYGNMARGRADAIKGIYSPESGKALLKTLMNWHVDYVYLGPVEREMYAITSRSEEILEQEMDLVFTSGKVRIYKRRGSWQ